MKISQFISLLSCTQLVLCSLHHLPSYYITHSLNDEIVEGVFSRLTIETIGNLHLVSAKIHNTLSRMSYGPFSKVHLDHRNIHFKRIQVAATSSKLEDTRKKIIIVNNKLCGAIREVPLDVYMEPARQKQFRNISLPLDLFMRLSITNEKSPFLTNLHLDVRTERDSMNFIDTVALWYRLKELFKSSLTLDISLDDENLLIKALYMDQFFESHRVPHDGPAIRTPTQFAPQLIQYGYHLEVKTQNNRSFLSLAVQANKTELVDQVLRFPVDIDAQDDGGMNPIILAAENGNVQVLDSLARKGANLNAANIYGTSALHNAAILGNSGFVRRLLEWKVDPNPRDEDGWTPLFYAFDIARIEIVDLLVRGGASVLARDNQGFSILNLLA